MNLEHLVRPITAASGFDVIGVEHDRAQVVWSALPPEGAQLRIRSDAQPARTRLIDLPGAGPDETGLAGPDLAGAAELTELDAATRYSLTVHAGTAATAPAIAAAAFSTLQRPAGEELDRFATVSDLHLGRGARRYRGPLAGTGTEHHHRADAAPRDGGVDPTVLCAHAAVDDALRWGARTLVVKGDLCEETDDHAWALAGALLSDMPVPVWIVPGNHDTGRDRQFEPEEGATAHGLQLVRGVQHHDLDGLRLVLVDSTRPGHGWGAIARHAGAVADLVADAERGAFVATHHQAQRISIPLYWPHGIPGPDARSFARTVRRASTAVLVSSGHTHRCRVRRVAGLTWSEVAATNHYPGMWAGYRIFEGGITQTVRRITAPAAMAWCEHTRAAFGGVWALWSPGSLNDRSFTLQW